MMNKKMIKIVLIFMVISCIFINISLSVGPTGDISDFKPEVTEASDKTASALNAALSIIQVVGIATATIMLLWLGIKYMISSASDRAEIKKHATVYIIGAVIMFGASGIVGIIRAFSKNF